MLQAGETTPTAPYASLGGENANPVAGRSVACLLGTVVAGQRKHRLIPGTGKGLEALDMGESLSSESQAAVVIRN